MVVYFLGEKKRELNSIKTLVAFILFYLLLEGNAFASTTKEVWLKYSGANYCQPFFCADDIPAPLLENALNFFIDNQKIINNVDFLTIIDFTQLSTKKRMYILNLNDGTVEKLLVTHARNSESTLGQAKRFSNRDGSKMSSIGFYLIDPLPYRGKHGSSLKMTGLSKTNSNARSREIVLHSADYATQEFADSMGRLGLSWGCFAIDPKKISGAIRKMKGESLLYVYSDQPSI